MIELSKEEIELRLQNEWRLLSYNSECHFYLGNKHLGFGQVCEASDDITREALAKKLNIKEYDSVLLIYEDIVKKRSTGVGQWDVRKHGEGTIDNLKCNTH